MTLTGDPPPEQPRHWDVALQCEQCGQRLLYLNVQRVEIPERCPRLLPQPDGPDRECGGYLEIVREWTPIFKDVDAEHRRLTERLQEADLGEVTRSRLEGAEWTLRWLITEEWPRPSELADNGN